MTGEPRSFLDRVDLVLLAVFLAAGAFRVYFALTTPQFFDESDGFIPLAQTISFSPSNPNLPIRARNHPALVAYVVKLSGDIAGETPAGYRALHVLAGLTTILLLYRITRDAYGRNAGLWAASLLAFNEYHILMSSAATSPAIHLLLASACVFFVQRLLVTERVRFLYAAVVTVALAFYVKETSALLLVVLFLTLLGWRRHWLRSPHLYGAGILCVLVVMPDVLWNLGDTHTREQATYAAHLSRIGGLGLSPYPLAFYARDLVQMVPQMGFTDYTGEYTSTNPVLGLAMLMGVILAATRIVRPAMIRPYLLTYFALVFGFFLLVRTESNGYLDPAGWVWVDMTVIPAVILTAAAVTENSPSAVALKVVAVIGLLYAVIATIA